MSGLSREILKEKRNTDLLKYCLKIHRESTRNLRSYSHNNMVRIKPKI
jgi:hypothetical protein